MDVPKTPTSLKIKPNEIDIAFINSPVVTPFCISWAEDDKISVVAEGGVFVFELWPTPLSEQQSITFIRSWIPAPVMTPLTKAVVDDKNGAFIWNFGRKQAFETSLDSTLSCAVQKSNLSLVSSHIVKCEFSPLIGCKSYISCLTNIGSLEIYSKNLNKWKPIVNITQLWISHCNINATARDINFDYFQSQMLKLKITTMKWFQKPEIIFLTGHENGLIVFWDVTASKDSLKISVRHEVKVEKKPCNLQLIPITNSQNCILLVGTLSGNVIHLSVNFATGEINQKFDLWKDEDLAPPVFIKAELRNNKLLILAVKHHILLIQNCSVNKLGQSELLTTKWQEFPTKIVGWEEFNDDYIVCLQNHDAYTLSLKDYNSVQEMKKIDTGIKLKHKNSHHCYGLAMSQNKAIWILVSSPKVNYQSLKEITQMIIYTPQIKIFKELTDSTSSRLLEQVLKQYKSIRLSDIFDYLELKKVELLTGVSKFREKYDIHENLTLTDLQLLLWEVKLKLFRNWNPEVDVIATKLEVFIAKKQAAKVVANLERLSTISPLQKESLVVCQALLLNSRDREKSSNEMCRVCGSERFFEGVRISSCLNSHKFPRCCLSFLPCDVAPYAACRNCDSVALLDFVLENGDRCTFCDGLLERDTRISW